MGLLLISGSQPIPIRREFYFESKSLRGYYDPHRDFPSPPTLVELDAIIAREKRKAEEAAERKRRIADEESQRKRKEEEIAAWNRERRAEVARMRAEWDAKPWWQKFHWPQTRKFLRNVAILFTAIGVGMWWLMS